MFQFFRNFFKTKLGLAIALAFLATCCQDADGLAPTSVLTRGMGKPDFTSSSAPPRRKGMGGLADGCAPLRSYTRAQTSAWLKSQVPPCVRTHDVCAACTACELSLGPRQSFNVSQAYDGIIDGESLLAFANSPNALSRDSLLLEVVPLSQLARLVYAIQVSPAMK